MNWTGGRLQSSKRNGGVTSAKQKAYFVKARARQRAASTAPSPIRFPIFDDVEHHPQHSDHRNREQQSHGRSKLDRLDGPSRQAGTYPEPEQCMQQPRSYTWRGNPVADPVPKRPVEPKDYLEAKRLALLQRTDWLGLNVPRPLEISFPSTRERQRIGRRRERNHVDLLRQRERARSCQKPVQVADHRGRGRPRQSSRGYPEGLRPDEVSIRFGTSIQGSQQSPSIPGQQSHSHGMLCRSGECSDLAGPMLLDDEGAQPEDLGAVESRPYRQNGMLTARTRARDNGIASAGGPSEACFVLEERENQSIVPLETFQSSPSTTIVSNTGIYSKVAVSFDSPRSIAAEASGCLEPINSSIDESPTSNPGHPSELGFGHEVAEGQRTVGSCYGRQYDESKSESSLLVEISQHSPTVWTDQEQSISQPPATVADSLAVELNKSASSSVLDSSSKVSSIQHPSAKKVLFRKPTRFSVTKPNERILIGCFNTSARGLIARKGRRSAWGPKRVEPRDVFDIPTSDEEELVDEIED